ncbi:hypothetical protein K431DRAFT_170651 [Polychaeton citri CBS 116435]|uniref:Uncharacterized protein n=1 Tax=Polychaeton citri CBS 116435 TaxID=1314669 RepID=A0A9P4Q1I3_9PEZI|nr:hypothetical protein K431DRAFT_170651 [Polychaeton citri CBS 116435]
MGSWVRFPASPFLSCFAHVVNYILFAHHGRGLNRMNEQMDLIGLMVSVDPLLTSQTYRPKWLFKSMPASMYCIST